jgi:hypothetical protein
MSLVEVTDQAVDVIQSHRRAFRHLVSLIRQRHLDLIKNRNIQTGRHKLLTKADLDGLFSEYEAGAPKAD